MDRSPLTLDDDVARDLLKGLVTDASEVQRGRPARIAFPLILLKTVDGYSLEMVVDLPPSIPESDLAAQLGVPSEALAARLQLAAVPDSGSPKPIAIASRRQGTYILERTHASCIARGSDCFGGIRLSALSGTQQLGPGEVAAGSVLSEFPWVFAEGTDTSKWRLRGQGSVKTRSNSVLIAIDKNTIFQLDEGSVLNEVGVLEGLERPIVQLQGMATFVSQEGSWKVRTQQAQENAARYQVRGQRFPWQDRKAATLFLGLPEVYCGTELGEAPVRKEELQWKQDSTDSSWTTIENARPGEGWLRHVVAGELFFKQKIRWIPECAGITLCPGDKTSNPKIIFDRFEQPRIGVHPESNVEFDCTALAKNDRIELCVNRRSSSNKFGRVNCQLVWNSDPALGIEVPYPGEYGHFVARDGSSLEEQAILAVGRLAGVIAEAYTPRKDVFIVHGRLFDGSSNTLDVFEYLEPGLQGGHTLDLARLQQAIQLLFACTRVGDASVELRIERLGPALAKSLRIHVSRFESTFEFDEEEGRLEVPEDQVDMEAELEDLRFDVLP